MLHLIAAVAWLVIGAYTMFYKKGVTVVDYFCVWIVALVAHLAQI